MVVFLQISCNNDLLMYVYRVNVFIICDIYYSINHTTNYLEEMTSTLLPYINCMGITRGIKMPYNSLLQILQSKLVRKIINTFTLYDCLSDLVYFQIGMCQTDMLLVQYRDKCFM
jgi:hypothetical protein